MYFIASVCYHGVSAVFDVIIMRFTLNMKFKFVQMVLSNSQFTLYYILIRVTISCGLFTFGFGFNLLRLHSSFVIIIPVHLFLHSIIF